MLLLRLREINLPEHSELGVSDRRAQETKKKQVFAVDLGGDLRNGKRRRD